MQKEDEYRIQMELKRYLRKESLSAGASSEQSFYETETARTPSSRGKYKRWYSIAESPSLDYIEGLYKRLYKIAVDLLFLVT